MADDSDATRIGDDLYVLPPQQFTAARDARVAHAKNAGDRETATALARMKRPTMAGWLVNLVALRRPDLLAGLLELGDQIRAAQGTVPPAQLRDLSAQRRRLLDGLIAQACSLAGENGVETPAPQHLTEAESTFSAAMADEDAARLVRSGRVLRPLSYSGFGSVSGLVGAPPIAAAPRRRARPEPGAVAESDAVSGSGAGRAATGPGEVVDARAARRAAQAAAAEAAVAEARTVLDRARDAEREATERAGLLASELADLQRRAAAADREARAARQDRMAAERALAAAERRLPPKGRAPA